MERWVEVEVDDGDVDVVSGLLWAGGVTAVEERVVGSGRTLLVAGLTAGSDGADLVDLIASRWPVHLCEGEVDHWLDTWQEWAQPVRVSPRLVVVPDWVSSAESGGGEIRLARSRAFGDGSHPSTRLVLEHLEELVRPGDALLDVGCGSGVLATAAALLGASRVVAIDLDPEAVRATAATARASGVAGAVEASATPLADVNEVFGLVVANIGAGVLIELADELALRVAVDGVLVLSGLLDRQLVQVEQAYPGFERRNVSSFESWSCSVLRRSGRLRPRSRS